MANQEHLDILKQGVALWNQWRKEHPEVKPDLIQANLNKADLSSADFSEADLSSADFSFANLSKTNLSRADFSFADLSRANLNGAYLSRANLKRAFLADANLNGAYLYNTDLSAALLMEAHLIGAHLNEARLNGANLSQADLSRANLSGANLGGANLNRANLNRVTLSRAYLYDSDLSTTDLIEADLKEADLSRANLSRADLGFANLSRADLGFANLSRAIVGWTIFGDLDFRTVKGLETLEHRAPSTIGTDTISRSQGDIPEAFLRGAGLSETFIDYARSLAQRPIEYYTCFISYSSKDQEFAEYLYADLQSKGVRCWFAREDLKIGDKWRERIDESIRRFDKLLLVLSHHSIQSPWVEDEIAAAIEKEHQQHKLVLFPIRLDEAVMQATQAWAASIRRTRHIGNFCGWKEHNRYQQGFKRLLRDLKAEAKA